MEAQSAQRVAPHASRLHKVTLIVALLMIFAEATFAQSSIRLVGEPGQPTTAAAQDHSRTSPAGHGIRIASNGAMRTDLYNSMFTALTGEKPSRVWSDTAIASPVTASRASAEATPPREPAPIDLEASSHRIVLNIEPAGASPDGNSDIATKLAQTESAAGFPRAPRVDSRQAEDSDVFKSLLRAAEDQAPVPQLPAPPRAQKQPATIAATPPLADITPIGSEPPAVAQPRPLDSDDYKFAAETERIQSPEAKPADPEPIASNPLPSFPQVAVRPKPIVLAERPPVPEIASSDISISPNHAAALPQQSYPAASRGWRSHIVSTAPQPPATAAPQESVEQPAHGGYLNDSISAGGSPGCEDPASLPGGCPYYPCQSGAREICGVDCGPHGAACCETWENARLIPWSMLGPGEYVGPPRPEHVPAYYLRVNDLITLTYIVSRQKQPERYRIGVGDRLRVESGFDDSIDRELLVQPDGEITLPLIGDVPAAGKTVKELRDDLIERYGRIEREPIITITPMDVNIGLREILNAVTSQSNRSGQALDLRVTPEGTIQAPGLGSVYVQGLAIEELRTELEARYAATFGPGLLVSPALTERATSYVFLGGEVANPGRYVLEGPTTVMQAISLAGGWNNGGNMREVVIFRRDENWCLKATKINVHRPFYGKDPCPVNDVWLRDNDLVVVPKTRILCAADVIELYFTRGVYAVFPITFVKDFSTGSSVVPVGP